jgi:hypothetical protein
VNLATPSRFTFGGRVRFLRVRAPTTPGRLRALTGVVVVGTALLWLLGAGAVVAARQHMDAIGRHTALMMIDAQRTHALLADADRLAADDFLLGGAGSSEQRQEYELDISSASRDLEQMAELNGPNGPASAQLQQITTLLTQYTGLVEAARANARAGFPVGASYMRQASDVMHRPGDGIMALVDGLDSFDPADPGQDNATRWLPGGLLAAFFATALGLLGVLVYTQVYLRRRFRRRRCHPLLASMGLLLVLAGWMGAQAAVTYSSQAAAEGDALPRLHRLWVMRSAASEANADQSLALISRGSAAGPYDEAFKSATGRLVDRTLTDNMADAAAGGDVRFRGLVAEDLGESNSPAERADAVRVLRGYQEFIMLDGAIRARIAAGDYDGAVPLVVGTNQLGTAFTDLDRALQTQIDTEQARFDAGIANAIPGPALDAGLAVLAAGVAGLFLWGLRPRLAEYRT